MSFDKFMRLAQSHNASLEALAAIGAELSLRQSPHSPAGETRRLIGKSAHLASDGSIDALNAEQQVAALNFIRAFFRQAADLLDQPDRAPGWIYEDPSILQAQGRASRLVVHHLSAATADYPPLAHAVSGPAAFLDIGTGTGWLAIAAAEQWPHMSLTGLDIWRPALELAQQNVVAAGLAERIQLKEQSIAELDEVDVYSLAWLPGPFIPLDIVPAAVGRIWSALRPGGVLVFGSYGSPPNDLAEVLAKLRIHRSGGHPWAPQEIAELLTAAGFAHLHQIRTDSPIAFTLAQKPSA